MQLSRPPSPSHLLSSFHPLRIFSFCTLTTPHVPGCFSISCFLFPHDSLRVLQWNTGGLRARSIELLHIISSYHVDLICIQESNLNSSSSFRIPGFAALRSDRSYSWSGILSPDTTQASGGVIIFVRQGLFYPELSTSSLFLFA